MYANEHRYKEDGLNTVKYRVIQMDTSESHIHITVDLGNYILCIYGVCACTTSDTTFNTAPDFACLYISAA